MEKTQDKPTSGAAPSCCSGGKRRCERCGNVVSDPLVTRCPRCWEALPRMGCDGCTGCSLTLGTQ